MNVVRLAGIIMATAWVGLLPTAAAPTNSAAPLSQSGLLSHNLQAQDAAGAWTELTNANHQPPPVPAEWRGLPPTTPERQKFYLPYLEALTEKSKDFYTRFPKDDHAIDGKLIEFELLLLQFQWGQTNQMPRLEAATQSLIQDPALKGDKRYQMLWPMALNCPPDLARPLLQSISRGAASDSMREAATEELKKLDALGKPVKLEFSAVDGRSVDLAKLKGKVVLIDFWATWCRPCVAEVPDVKEAYDRFHAKGFEIVGISLDKDKEALTKFVAEHKMEWPQYFDGLFWDNKYARQFGIQSIPAMWLIDKKGLLRVVDARANLSGTVQQLLAE
jgi:peroxiredoxin